MEIIIYRNKTFFKLHFLLDELDELGVISSYFKSLVQKQTKLPRNLWALRTLWNLNIWNILDSLNAITGRRKYKEKKTKTEKDEKTEY